MRHDKLVPGTILICLGVIFLLSSFGVIHLHFWSILRLWPVFVVIAGINLIFANNRSGWASALKIGVVVLGLFVLVFGRFENDRQGWRNNVPHFNFKSDDNDNDGFEFDFDDNDSDGKAAKLNSFIEPFHADAKIVKLSVKGGAAGYTIADSTAQLFQADTKEYTGGYFFTSNSLDSVYNLKFSTNKNTKFNFGKNKANSVDIKLNTTPIWDVDVQAGAAEMNFDLTKFKVRNLDLNGGAASFKLKLGQPLDTTRIDVNTGAASVRISVPMDAACKITTNTGLSSKDFKGFHKIDDNHYESEGYAAAKKKIIISFDGGVSEFKVTRY
ncbi:LiaI-LiaF-like domain-containing protein [Mucilaginibacter myungsuensis]|uniref:LiaI-LiaF-like transmembrane region domain-containing protein n=1 Tax=Mucilaginibacter myungsuensis TaxID=649104 RepID=A0A929KUJ3_9SPHI|nr:DUF5668 domain-containing protein [Mucilaginibacter myungsuensis]MBE9660700.1 hypothetical protein [Mucilaginibacter myungsuensis]MDN3600745.1 DUF5668 domain-containing protein [Mucilaginibacter myungsuensis]